MGHITITLKDERTFTGELNKITSNGILVWIYNSENIDIPQDFGLYDYSFDFRDILRIEGNDQGGIQEARDLMVLKDRRR